MKKRIIQLLLFCMSFTAYAETIDIFNLEPNENNPIFEELSMKEQYDSLLISFKTKTKGFPIPYESKWANIIIEKWGREILPLINKTLEISGLDHQYRLPVNKSLSILGYLFNVLRYEEMLTDEEILMYGIIINEKIDKYILKYRVIDTSVCDGFFILRGLGEKTLSWGNMENIKIVREYYEKKLGITGIAIGKDIFEDIVPSPLAEYITD